MTIDNVSAPRDERPRKTLDEIRHEIEADFAPPGGILQPVVPEAAEPLHRPRRHQRPRRLVATAGPVDEDQPVDVDIDVANTEHERATTRRRPRRTGYIFAALVGCLIGQIVILVYLTVAYYRIASTTAAVRVAMSGAPDARATSAVPPVPLASPVSNVGTAVSSTQGDVSVTSISSESQAAGPASETPLSQQTAAPLVAVATPAPPPSPPPTRDAAVANANERKPFARLPVPREIAGQRRTMSSPSPIEPPAPRESRIDVMAAEDWAKSQEQVRAALKAWLIAFGVDDDLVVGNAVVILDADGRSARTHVPVRMGRSLTVHEQRWQRVENGWQFVADREAPRDR